MQKNELTDTADGNEKYIATLETVWQFLLKLNIYIKYIFTIQLSDATTQKEMKIYVHSKIHI